MAAPRLPDWPTVPMGQFLPDSLLQPAARPGSSTPPVSGEHAEGWAAARKILCVRLDTLGDVLMTTPAFKALKERAPGNNLTVLTSPAGAEVAEHIPTVDKVLTYDAPWMKATAGRESSGPDLAFIEDLRGENFDAAVIFTVYSQNPLPSAMLCYLADIPLRLAHCRENPYQLLTDWVRDPEPDLLLRHEVRRQLDLVAAAGFHTGQQNLSFCVPNEAREKANLLLAELALEGPGSASPLEDPPAPWAVLHPGGSALSRRYRPHAYAEAAKALLGGGWQLLVTGTASERSFEQEIRARLPMDLQGGFHDLTGRLDLPELAALLEQAPLLISNNTGPVHLAAAVGIPVVDLYALTNPQHAPWGVPARVLYHDVPCKYCYRSVCPLGHNNCLQLVPAAQVVTAAVELVSGASRPQPVRRALGSCRGQS